MEPVGREEFPCERENFRGFEKLCDEKDVILIFDEVQCGIGRVGKFLCF